MNTATTDFIRVPPKCWATIMVSTPSPTDTRTGFSPATLLTPRLEPASRVASCSGHCAPLEGHSPALAVQGQQRERLTRGERELPVTRAVQHVDPRGAPPCLQSASSERRMTERGDRADRMIETVAAAADQHDVVELAFPRGAERELGVGHVLVRGVHLDRYLVRSCPGDPGRTHRIEVADDEFGAQPGGESMVEAGVSRDDEGPGRKSFEGWRQQCRAAGDNDRRPSAPSLAAGSLIENSCDTALPSAGITQIRLKGRRRRAPSQPAEPASSPWVVVIP